MVDEIALLINTHRMTQRREIRFNDGHVPMIRQFLETGEVTATPEELAAQATDAEKIDIILDTLQQELSNNAFPLMYIELLMSSLEEHAQDIENHIDDVEGELRSFTESIDKAITNAPLIVECMEKILATDKVVVDAGKPTLLTEKARLHVAKITQDQLAISEIIERDFENYNRIYEDAYAKWEAAKKK